MTQTWGNDIFGGFARLTPANAKARLDAEVMQDIGYILANHKITPRRLCMIIEASEKEKRLKKEAARAERAKRG